MSDHPSFLIESSQKREADSDESTSFHCINQKIILYIFLF